MFKRIIGLILAIICCVYSFTVFAQNNEVNLNKLRKLDVSKVDPQLLSQVLKFEEIFIDDYDIKDINNFAKRYSDFPVCAFSDKILGNIEFIGSSSDIQKWFSLCRPQNSKEMMIAYTFDNKITDKHVIEQWLNKVDLPLKFEKFLVHKFGDYITPDKLLRKIDKLIYHKRYDVALYYSGLIGEESRNDVKLKIKLFSSEGKFQNVLDKAPHLIKYPIVKIRKLGILIKKDEEKEALKGLELFKGYEEESWRARHALVRNLIRSERYKEAYKLAQNHGLKDGENYQDAEWILGWISYHYFKDYKAALHHFRNIHENANYYTSKSKASYWIWKTYLNLDEHKSASIWYQEILRSPAHFYSQLAIAETKKFSEINMVTDLISNEKDYKSMKYANIYWMAGIQGVARNILKRMEYNAHNHKVTNVSSKPAPLRVIAAKNIANKYGLVAKLGYPMDIKIKNNVFKSTLYWGIIRQESEFDQGALSPAGAVGMMQLMPGTAHICAKALNIDKEGFRKSADKNVEKGVYYLNGLIEKYENIIPAIAAYNAGEKPVNIWIENFGDPKNFSSREEYINWIESIPYSETRLYVKKVLENMFVYELISNKNFIPSEFLLKDYTNYKMMN